VPGCVLWAAACHVVNFWHKQSRQGLSFMPLFCPASCLTLYWVHLICISLCRQGHQGGRQQGLGGVQDHWGPAHGASCHGADGQVGGQHSNGNAMSHAGLPTGVFNFARNHITATDDVAVCLVHKQPQELPGCLLAGPLTVVASTHESPFRLPGAGPFALLICRSGLLNWSISNIQYRPLLHASCAARCHTRPAVTT